MTSMNNGGPAGPVDQLVRPLVERLRGGVYGLARIELCREAADEIERLGDLLGSIGQSASTAGLEQQSDLEVVIHYEGDAYNRPLGRGLLLGNDYLEDMIPEGDCHVSVTVYRRRSNVRANRPGGAAQE